MRRFPAWLTLPGLVAALLAALGILLGGAARAPARDPSYRIATWALPLGAQARLYETFCGLKAMLTFLNGRGGIDGRLVDFYSQEMDDSTPNFPARLNTMIQQAQPDVVVGGAVAARSGDTAEYFRRAGVVWFGPWSQRASLYKGEKGDPVGLLPSLDFQLDLLAEHAAKTLGPGADALILWQDGPGGRSDFDPEVARAKLEAHGLTPSLVAVPYRFRDWASLREPAAGAEAILLWVPSGPAAAIVRVLKPVLPAETLFLTHALNPPGVELMDMTDGLWDGMIFPAVLDRDPALALAYDAIIRKYGPPGLSPGYLSYLGVAQAQIMTRLLASQTPGTTREAVRRDFLGVDSQGTMLTSPGFGAGPPPPGAAFAARAVRPASWEPVETP
jgi:ABC-type branched-subunit amino acid transport system substrate-binding protein